MNRRGLFGILTSRRDAVSGDSQDHQDVSDGSVILDRRQLLQRAAVAGLVLATPKFWPLDRTMLGPGCETCGGFAEWVEAKEGSSLILPQTLRLIPMGGPTVQAVWLDAVDTVLAQAVVPSHVLSANTAADARLPFQQLTYDQFGEGVEVNDVLLWAPIGSGMRNWRPLESPNGQVAADAIPGT